MTIVALWEPHIGETLVFMISFQEIYSPLIDGK